MKWTLASIARGAALGGYYALSVALLAAALIFASAMPTYQTPSQPTIHMAEYTADIMTYAVIANLIAIAIAAVARPNWLAPVFAVVLFLVALDHSISTLPRDLNLINYSQRSHRDLSLETIAARSPSETESKTYEMLYALRRRIAGGDLYVVHGAPFDDWQLTYRADSAAVTRASAADLPTPPSLSEVAAWGTQAHRVDLVDGAMLVLSPEITRLRARSDGQRFAIVQVTPTTFALVPFPDRAP